MIGHNKFFNRIRIAQYAVIRIGSIGWITSGVIIFITMSCTSNNSDVFRTRASKDHSIQYKSPTRMKVTGTGCALTIEEAQDISKNVAEYNLRTVIGKTKFTSSIREIDRYVEDGRHCIITEIESY